MSISEEKLSNHKPSKNSFDLYESKIYYKPVSKTSITKTKENYVSERNFSKVRTSESNRPKQKEEDLSTHLPSITGWRRALKADTEAIERLQNLTGDIANLMYQNGNIIELIEKSYFPIVQLDSEGELISFTVYNPYPNVPSVSSSFWTEWLSTTYRLKDVTERNVLYIHYMVWQPCQERKFLRLLLQTSFREFVHLKHIIIVKPPHIVIPDFYSEYFSPVRPNDLDKLDFDSVQSLLVCFRTSVIRSLPIRLALKEELDFIISVINVHMRNSKETEKAKILDFTGFPNQEDKKILICEFATSPSGIMIVNQKINLNQLTEGFELAPFKGLKKDREEDKKLDSKEEELYKSGSLTVVSFEDIEDRFPELPYSEFMFSQMNWELSASRTKEKDSFNKSTSFTIDSDSSELAVLSMFSFYDLEKIEEQNSQKFTSGKTFYDRPETSSKKALGDGKLQIRSSPSTVTQISQSQHQTIVSCNAFVIEFLWIDSSLVDDKLSSFDFLNAAFNMFSDKEYCLLILPTDFFFPFPLMDLFVRVTPRLVSPFKKELYLCHRNSILSTSMKVKKTEKEDLSSVHQFLRNVNGNDIIYHDILRSCFTDNKECQSFLLTTEEEIIGVSLIDFQDYKEIFSIHFDVKNDVDIKQYESENQSVIKHLILNPVYYNQVRFFLNCIMRWKDLTCLYYVSNEHKKAQFNNLIGEFFPVKPKKKAGLTESYRESSIKVKIEVPFSLYLMDSRLCEFTKLHINIVIVVVGASRTALSFLESLIYGPDTSFINFNNLICVSPHGSVKKNSTEAELMDLMFPIRDNFSSKYRSMVSLDAYVSFINGIMTEINRTQKYIVINNREIVNYDFLILTCGCQYLLPEPKEKEASKNVCKKDFTRSSLARFLFHPDSKKITPPKYPLNMFIVNTTKDAENALHSLEKIIEQLGQANTADKKIVVYGHNLNVFLTINTLLKLGIPGEIIVFVEPFPTEERKVTIFNDHYVDQAVLESIKNCHVVYYTEYFFYGWTLTADDYIASITFHSKYKQIRIPCLAFFPYVQKLVSNVTFNACKNAGLVYDGRLVINRNFRTNDNYIYAAGPFTKYARRYYASDKDHKFFNSTEVGQKLAHIIRRKIFGLKEDENDSNSNLVIQMKAPLIVYCQLPGDFNLFILRKPGKFLELETAYNFLNYGEVLTTGGGNVKNDEGYFRLHLSPEGFVESITCYTKNVSCHEWIDGANFSYGFYNQEERAIDYINLCSLYGLHERLLNNLLLRYDLANIPDLFAYFRQPWALPLFNENFQFLRELNYKSFESALLEENDNFMKEIIEENIQNKWTPLTTSFKKKMEAQYTKSSVEREIKSNLLQFLEYYEKQLFSYATPKEVERLLCKSYP